MTRPRSQQLNDPATRYSRYAFRLAPTPGASFTEIQNDGVNNDYEALIASSSTALDTGLEESIPAIALGVAPDPYIGLSPGNSFTVTLPGVNGGSPITVALTAAEFVILNAVTVTTAIRVAARVNAVLAGFGVAAAVASRDLSGALKFESADTSGFTTGDSASITISAVTPGILTALGFGAVSSVIRSGSSQVRGIVTKSRDGRGGYLFPLYESGRRVTQNSKVFKNFGRVGFSCNFVQEVPPKQPIFGRISKIPGTFLTKKIHIDWMTKSFGAPDIKSQFSNFTTIVPGDGFDVAFIDAAYGGVASLSVVFSFTPVTVADVVTQINDQWQFGGTGRVGVVCGGLFEPFATASGIVFISLNGLPTVTVNLTGLERTTAAVAAAINSAIALAGQGAQGSASSLGGKLIIESSQVTGPLSSVEILPDSSSEVLRSIGLSVGKYVGTDICFADGAEIVIRSPSRSSSYSLTASTGTTLTKLGIAGQIPVFPALAFTAIEYPATFPHDAMSEISLLSGLSATATDTTSAMFPEYMEAGDIPDDNFTVNDRAAGVSSTDTYPILWQRGALASLANAMMDGDGRLPESSIPTSLSIMQIGNVRFSSGTLPSVPKQVYAIGSGAVELQAEYVINGAFYSIRDYFTSSGGVKTAVESINARWNGVNYTADNVPSPSFIFTRTETGIAAYVRAGASASPFTPVVGGGIRAHILDNSKMEIFTSSGYFMESVREMRFMDSNTLGSTDKYLNLSSALAFHGDTNLRVGEKDGSLSGTTPSLLSAVNSRPFITCGDGVNTFGDFNGSNALLDVAVFLNAQAITVATIFVKRGTYTAASTVQFTNKTVDIIGQPGAIIDTPTAVGDTIRLTSTTAVHAISLRDVKVQNTHPARVAVKVDRGSLSVTRCFIQGDVYVKLGTPIASSLAVHCVDSSFNGKTDNFTLEFGTGFWFPTPTLFTGCSFLNSLVNTRCLVIRGQNSLCSFKPIKFTSCYFILSSYTSTLHAPTGFGICTKNTGLVDLEPQNNGRVVSGLTVDSLTYEDCVISAAAGGGNYVCALQLPHLPANQIPTDAGNFGFVKKLNFNRCQIELIYAEFGNANIFTPFTTGTGAEEVNVVDTDFIMNPGGSGGGFTYFPPAWAAWSVNDGIPGEPGFGKELFQPASAGQWGAVSFISRRVNIRNVRMKNAFRESLFGDMTFFYGNLNVDGLSFEYNQTNAGSGTVAPWSRLFFSEVRNAGGDHSTVWPGSVTAPGGSPNPSVRNTASIKNVRFETFDNPVGKHWSVFPGAMVVGFGSFVDIDKITMLGGTEGGFVPTNASGAGGGILFGSADITVPVVTGTTDLRIRNCDIRNVTYGIFYRDTQNSGDRGGVHIGDNYISKTSLSAISVFAPWYPALPVVPGSKLQFHGVKIVNNTVIECQAVAGVYGAVELGVPATIGIVGSQSIVSGNSIQYSPLGGGIPSGISIFPSFQGSAPVTPFGPIPPNVSCFGNTVILFSISQGTGYISIVGWDPAGSAFAPLFGWEVDTDFVSYEFSGFVTSYMTKKQDATATFTSTTAPIVLPTATVPVTSTAGFTAFGSLAISTGVTGIGYVLTYSSKDATNFFGCTGGALPWPAGSKVIFCERPHENYEHGKIMMMNRARLKNDGAILLHRGEESVQLGIPDGLTDAHHISVRTQFFRQVVCDVRSCQGDLSAF